MTDKRHSLWDKIWKDKDGNLAIWQFPNIPLWVWLACIILARIFSGGRIHGGVSYLADVALVVWAYLEITDGLCYFRRTLGAVVFISVIAPHFM